MHAGLHFSQRPPCVDPAQGAAIALDYVFGRSDLPESVDHHVVFIDAGHAGVQACVVRARRDSAEVLAHAFAPGTAGAVSRCSIRAARARAYISHALESEAANGELQTQTKICSDGSGRCGSMYCGGERQRHRAGHARVPATGRELAPYQVAVRPRSLPCVPNTTQAMDELLCAHLAADFRDHFQVDALAEPRAASRLRQASERVRRVLSANAEGTVALDCLVGETDVHGSLTRSQLESLSGPLIDRAMCACLDAVRGAGLVPAALDAVELLGGYSRTPAFIAAVQRAFGREPSRSLNAEESVARGAALAAGLRSRTLRMRPLRLHEGLLHATSIHWEREGGGTPLGCHMLPKAGTVPLLKRITLRTRSRMQISCRYDSSPRQLACRVELGKGAGDDASDAARALLRVDVLIDDNQLPSIRAYEVTTTTTRLNTTVEVDGVFCAPAAPEETASDGPGNEGSSGSADSAEGTASGGASPDETSSAAAAAAHEHPVAAGAKGTAEPAAPPPVMVRALEVAELSRLGLREDELKRARDLELSMQRADEAAEKADAAKNDLEGQIYQVRATLEERLAGFASDDERQALATQLEACEGWLYGEGEQQSAQRYEHEREAVRAILEPLEERAASHLNVAAELEALDAECAKLRALHGAKPSAAEYSESMLATVAEAERWAANAREKLAAGPRNKEPAILPAKVHAQLEDLRAAQEQAKAAQAQAQAQAAQEQAAAAEAASAAAATADKAKEAEDDATEEDS